MDINWCWNMLKSQVRRLQRTGAVAAAAQKNMAISDSVLANDLVQASVVHSSRVLQPWLDDRNFLIGKAWLAFTYQNVPTCPISTFFVPGLIGNLQGKSNRFTSPDEWQRSKNQFQANDIRCKQLKIVSSPKELRLGPVRSLFCALHFPLAGC